MEVLREDNWTFVLDCPNCGSSLKLCEADVCVGRGKAMFVDAGEGVSPIFWTPGYFTKCSVCAERIKISEDVLPKLLKDRLVSEYNERIRREEEAKEAHDKTEKEAKRFARKAKIKKLLRLGKG